MLNDSFKTSAVLKTKNVFIYDIPESVLVAAANTKFLTLYNGSTSDIRILSIKQWMSIVTAVTGVATQWELYRTTADSGTGGTTYTPWSPDPSAPEIIDGIVCRLKPSGGTITLGTKLRTYYMHSEETNAGTIIVTQMGGLEILPPLLSLPCSETGIIIPQNTGICVVQVTNTAAGNTGFCITIGY